MVDAAGNDQEDHTFMTRALILGGTGMIGRATARRLLAAGWQVDLTGRDASRMPSDITEAGGHFLTSDYLDGDQLKDVYGAGADLVVDCVCFTARDARRVLPFLADATASVVLSSKAVYADAEGRHANSDEAPRFPNPITEDQPTMAPGEGDYNSREGYGANKVAAELVLLDSGAPVTVLRPSKVHGEGNRRPREWVFLKQVLDGQPEIHLARRGEGVDHPTAAANIAALIETVAARPGARVLNAADPDAPSAREIAATVARHLEHTWNEVLVDDDSTGRTPWDAIPPVVLDMTAARELGYIPAGDYAATVAEELDWLVDAVRAGDPEGVIPPPGDRYFAQFLAS
jgi:nucleoside-diphosphate-sugar epimerase